MSHCEVIVYVRQGCPFCESTNELLTKESINFKTIEIDDESRKMLSDLTHEKPEELTVPKIMIGSKLIRTSDELVELKTKSALSYLVGTSGNVASISRDPFPESNDAVCVLHTGPTDKIWLLELERSIIFLGAKIAYIDVEKVGTFDLAKKFPYSVIVNRVSDAVIPPLARFVSSLLALASTQGIPIINGADSYSIATSKLAQHGFFHAAGLETPLSYVVRCVGDVDEAYKKLGGTVIMKPNAGSFGKGIKKLSDAVQLHDHALNASAYGNDGVAIIQRYHNVEFVNRVFILGGEVQCAVNTVIDKDTEFTAQCMASAQKRSNNKGKAAVTLTHISKEVKCGCLDVMKRSGIDVGSIEYLIDPVSQEPLFFDLNLLSTYPNKAVVGHDCWEQLAKYILLKK